MIKGINKVTKKKERKLFEINSLNDLNDFDFENAIPKYAKGIEITCKQKGKDFFILEIDYIIDLFVENLKEE